MRAAATMGAICCALNLAAQPWPQWGGPHRNFHADTKGLAASWPAEGPRRIWERPLGDGYSAIVTDGGTLYTMYRRGEEDVIVALEAATGKTVWEHAYTAPFTSQYELAQGPGPRSTPLIAGGRLIAAGPTGKIHCLDRRDGKVIWSHDLAAEFGASIRVRGYAPSPLAYRETVILPAGGPGATLVAFRLSDGAVVWKKHDRMVGYASPILIRVQDQEQLVALLAEEVIGVDPANGELLWSHVHGNQERVNASQPVWGPDGLLFLTTAYDGGCRALRLTRGEGKTRVEEVWSHRLMRVHFGNVIRMGDVVYASSGDFGPSPLAAVEVKTGQLLWRDRAFAKASLLAVEGRFLLLDEDGVLALATPTTKGLQVHAKATVMSAPAWTVPTLAGKRVYLRDRRKIAALELD